MAWWHLSVTPSFKKLRKKSHEFQAFMCYTASLGFNVTTSEEEEEFCRGC